MAMLTTFPTRRPAVALAALLAACGGGSGGGDAPSVPVEPPVVLGQPGAGDPDRYVALAVGNFWHFSGTASGGFGSGVDNLVAVTGTQVVNGTQALVLRESNPDGDGQPLQTAVVKDANGLAVLAGDPADDALTHGLIPYWELRFPLAAGSRFVQLDRTQQDLGQDLDGDGRTEKVALRSEVRVVGNEPVTVPVGSYADALRVDRALTMSITLSRDGQVVPATESASAWLVRDLGWVRRTRSLSLLGTVSTMNEDLDAYQVGGATGGVTVVDTPGVGGFLSAGTGITLAFPARPAGAYTATLSGLGGLATLSVPGAVSCRSGVAAPGGAPPMDCSLALAGSGTVLARVQATQETPWSMQLLPTPAVATPVNESRTFEGEQSIVGQVGPRGTSTYVVTGLTIFRYAITLSGLDQDADLHVYTDGTYSMELNCSLNRPGDVLPTPEDCKTTTNAGKLYIRVTAGELNTVGASYLLTVSASKP